MPDTADHASSSRHEGASTPVQSRWQRYRELRLTEEELATALLAPVVLFLLAVSFYPIAETIRSSFYTGYILESQPNTFVGFHNYEQLLFNNGGFWTLTETRFWNSFTVSMIYTFVSVPIELVIGLGMALLLQRAFTGKYFIQAAILFPWALPTVINAKIWAWMFHGQYGVINDILIRIGVLETTYPFLAKPDVALASMTFVTIWKTSSFMALILLAGLSGIPDHLYEAARMDGASRWRRFRDITLPLLKPTILVALIFRTLPAFQAFGLPYGLTGGGPGEATTTLVLFDHQLTFTQLAFGRGAAAATIIMLLALLISLIYVGTLYEPEVR